MMVPDEIENQMENEHPVAWLGDCNQHYWGQKTKTTHSFGCWLKVCGPVIKQSEVESLPITFLQPSSSMWEDNWRYDWLLQLQRALVSPAPPVHLILCFVCNLDNLTWWWWCRGVTLIDIKHFIQPHNILLLWLHPLNKLMKLNNFCQ